MAEQVLKVSLRQGYKIYIGFNNLSSLGEKLKSLGFKKTVVVTNPIIKRLYGQEVEESLKKADLKGFFLEVSEGEEHKSLKEAERLYEKLGEIGIKREDSLVALGGGVIGDLAGFVAGTYMRGIPLVQVPTTLVSQVDSSVGGKVAVNLSQGKNLIGLFYQPQLVLVDVSHLKTLPLRELKAGLVEVVKYGFIGSETLLKFVEENLDSLLKLEERTLTQVVLKCCKFKATIVEKDEKDLTGERAILNYGHTIGHALEVEGQYKDYLHGEAIALGMLVAAQIALELGFIGEELVERHERIFKRLGLPLKFSFSPEKILERITLDKKARGEGNIFVLLKGVGIPVVTKVSPEVVKRALVNLVRSEE